MDPAVETDDAEFREAVLRFADAVQARIPHQPLRQWLDANMPEVIPQLNLEPAAPPAARARRGRAEGAREKAEAGLPSARGCGSAVAVPAEAGPPDAGRSGSAARAPAHLAQASAARLLDEAIASKQLSPKLHAWQVPEVRVFVETIEEFLESAPAEQRGGQRAHACCVLAVLLRGVRGFHGIEERVVQVGCSSR